MALQKVEIDKNKVLLPGDVIELHFLTTSMLWIQSAQIAIIEWKLEKRKDWTIISNSLPANNRVIFTVMVNSEQRELQAGEYQTAGIGVTAVAIAAAIVAVGAITWLTLDKVLQLQETPAGKIAVAGTGLGIAAAGIALLLFFILPRK